MGVRNTPVGDSLDEFQGWSGCREKVSRIVEHSLFGGAHRPGLIDRRTQRQRSGSGAGDRVRGALGGRAAVSARDPGAPGGRGVQALGALDPASAPGAPLQAP
jgi:hypothetical protein